MERVLGSHAQSVRYEARDLTLAERRVALLSVPAALADDARRLWTDAGPPHAPLIDVFAVDGGVIGVFPLPEQAAVLDGATGLSREQRASLWVETYHGVYHAPASPPLRWVDSGGVLWVPSAAGVRAWLLPLPVISSDRDATQREDVRAMASATLAQLYGVSDPSDSTAMQRLPDAYRDAVEAWLEASAALPTPEQVAAALQVSIGMARVPVPTATTAVSLGAQSRVASARRRIRSFALREAAAFLVVVVLAALGFLGLLQSPEPTMERVTGIGGNAIPEQPVLVQHHELPTAVAGTLAPEALLWSRSDGQVCRSLLEHGPVPTPSSCLQPGLDPFVEGRDLGIGQGLGIALHQPFVVAYRNGDEQLIRVERFDNAEQFMGYDLFRYDDAGLLEERVRHSSTAERISRVTFDHEAGIFEDRRTTGLPTVAPCATLRFSLANDGGYASWRCLDAFGAPIPFAEGHDIVRFERTDRVETEVFELEDAPDETRPDGIRTAWLRRDVAGRVVEERFFDGAGALVESSIHGVPIVRTQWVAQGYERSLHDADDRVVEGPDGWAREQVSYARDTGAIERLAWLSADGEPRVSRQSGVARILFESDARGGVTRETYDDGAGRPTLNPNGIHQRTFLRDAHGHVLQECHHDLTGPMTSEALGGAHCMQHAHDSSGRVISARAFGTRFEPTVHRGLGVHEIRYSYDASGRLIEQWYYDAEGEPATSTDSSRGARIAYDVFGAVQSYHYLWAPNQPTTTRSGLAHVAFERDAAGRETSRCFSDTSGRAARLVGVVGAGASCILKTYDAQGRLDRLTYANAAREPVLVELDRKAAFVAAVVVHKYAPGVGLVEQRYYGPDGLEEVSPPRDCRQPASCLDASGWEWYSP